MTLTETEHYMEMWQLKVFAEIYAIIGLVVGPIIGGIAGDKGYSYGRWWIFGSAMFILALPLALRLKRNEEGIAARGDDHWFTRWGADGTMED